MAEITLNAEIRKEFGKGVKRLRWEGKIPGIFYIHGGENIPVVVPEQALRPLIYTSEMHIINLKLNNGVAHSCVLRDIQFDPITDRPIHFDLQGVRAEEKLTLEIPIILIGTPKGVKEGGTMQRVLHRLRLECLPRDIPERIEIDVSHLEINESVHVSDIKVPNVTILDSEDSTLVAVVPPTILREEEVTAEAPVEEITEPEVIGKGKKAEEEEEEEEEAKQPPAPAKKEEKKGEGPRASGEKSS